MAGVAACALIAAGAAGFFQGGAFQQAPVSSTWTAPGYELRLIAEQWSAPVGVAVSGKGELYVAEAGVSSGIKPRVIRLGPGARRKVVADDFSAPLTGIADHGGKLYVSYVGGVDVLDPSTGEHHPVLGKLPAQGDHPNTAVLFGPDHKLYFGLGTATNAGIIGEDNIRAGWVKTTPQLHDIPCQDVTIRGSNFTISNALTPEPQDKATTGAFSPFGKTTARLQVIKGAVPCTGAVYRASPDGTGLEVMAWGLRHPTALAFGPDGQLYTTVQGFQDRGSRPIVNDQDYLYRIEPGRWYGWPDFAGGRSITAEIFQKPSFPVTQLLAEAPGQPPSPIATFDPGSAVTGLIFPPAGFGLQGDALAALRDQIMQVNPRTGAVKPFAHQKQAGPWRPYSFAASPNGGVYLTDLGATRPAPAGEEPVPGEGKLWRLTRTGAQTPLSRSTGNVRWRWALVGAVLSLAGVGLIRKNDGANAD